MNDLYETVALRLRNAYRTGGLPPLRDYLAPDDLDGAYAVQALNTSFWVAKGRRIVGRKIGLTSKAVQQQLAVDQPDFGTLFADMQLSDGGVLPSGAVLQPKAEAEIAIVLGRDLTQMDVTPKGVAAAADYATAAIEIVDSRIADWKITFADTVADNGSSAFFVLGTEKHGLGGLDLFSCGMVMEADSEIVSLGTGAACLGNPLNAAAWLARTMVERGEMLRAGDVILTGALGPMVALRPGVHYKAMIGGIGAVSFSFQGETV